MSELKEKGLGVFINLDKWGISTFTLKIIAMITMIIDHVGFLFFQDNHQTYIILRSIGRISFPIFCFNLSDVWKNPSTKTKHIGAGRLNTILELVTLAVAFGMAYFLHTSYSYGGVMLIICFYVFNNHHIGRAISNLVLTLECLDLECSGGGR